MLDISIGLDAPVQGATHLCVRTSGGGNKHTILGDYKGTALAVMLTWMAPRIKGPLNPKPQSFEP